MNIQIIPADQLLSDKSARIVQYISAVQLKWITQEFPEKYLKPADKYSFWPDDLKSAVCPIEIRLSDC